MRRTDGLVIRGGRCRRRDFINGAEDVHIDGDYVYGVSVNVTHATSNKNEYHRYLAGIRGNIFGVAKLSDIVRKARCQLRPDPVVGNRLHHTLHGRASALYKNFTRKTGRG